MSKYSECQGVDFVIEAGMDGRIYRWTCSFKVLNKKERQIKRNFVRSFFLNNFMAYINNSLKGNDGEYYMERLITDVDD